MAMSIFRSAVLFVITPFSPQFPLHSTWLLSVSQIFVHRANRVVILSVGPLLPFEDFTSVLLSPGQVTGLSQGESSGGVATLMPLDLPAFL